MAIVVAIGIVIFGMLFFLGFHKTPAVKYNYNPVKFYWLSPIELEFLRLVNEHRINLGLNPLLPEKLACDVCRIRVLKDIANFHWGSHLGWEKMLIDANAKYGSHVYGNNYNTAIELFNAYMKSPKHKSALENKDRTHIGVSFIERRNHTILTKYK
jgi:hypothetical protein